MAGGPILPSFFLIIYLIDFTILFIWHTCNESIVLGIRVDVLQTNISNFSILVQCKKKRKRKRSDSVLWQTPLYRQKNPKSNLTTQKSHQNFNYITIAERIRTVSLGNDSHPTGGTRREAALEHICFLLNVKIIGIILFITTILDLSHFENSFWREVRNSANIARLPGYVNRWKLLDISNLYRYRSSKYISLPKRQIHSLIQTCQ